MKYGISRVRSIGTGLKKSCCCHPAQLSSLKKLSNEVRREEICGDHDCSGGDCAWRANGGGAGMVAAVGTRAHHEITAPQRVGHGEARRPECGNAHRVPGIER